jgi:hypothetical protein
MSIKRPKRESKQKGGAELIMIGGGSRSRKVKSLVEDVFLRRNSPDEMVTLAE